MQLFDTFKYSMYLLHGGGASDTTKKILILGFDSNFFILPVINLCITMLFIWDSFQICRTTPYYEKEPDYGFSSPRTNVRLCNFVIIVP